LVKRRTEVTLDVLGFLHFRLDLGREHMERCDTIRVAANGINFEVLTLGYGDRLAMCLHGFPEHACCWRFQMQVLANLGFRVWAPNLRGYGGTDSPPEINAYRLEALVEDVAALIRISGARETVVIAHDWGGELAWNLAMWRQALVQRLVILNAPHPACFTRELRRPVQLLKSWYMLFFQLPVFPEWLLGMASGKAISYLIRNTSSDPSCFTEEVLKAYRQNAARPGGLTAMINWYRALFHRRPMWRLHTEVPKIEAPTLFIWGESDRFLSTRTIVGIENYVSNLTLRVLPGVSHWVQEEAADTVNNMLEAWLTGSDVPDYANLSHAATL
jgi:epoxide hydrolase 4